ncbi:MAG: GNAT family N-acetyltransferase [Acidobacteria bacterium]|nr:GNAT family N-acetyltransferase [Acidobacteriota bacterium]
MFVLHTPRLLLREFDPGDAAFILGLLNEPSFIENIADKGVRTLEQAEAYLRTGPMDSYARRGHGLWAVVEKASGLPAGMCGLIKRDAFLDVDLGYAFLPAFWGRGLALEAAMACCGHARDAMGLRRLIAIVTPTNGPSIRLLGKLDFHPAGTTRMDPDPAELALYARDFS